MPGLQMRPLPPGELLPPPAVGPPRGSLVGRRAVFLAVLLVVFFSTFLTVLRPGERDTDVAARGRRLVETVLRTVLRTALRAVFFAGFLAVFLVTDLRTVPDLRDVFADVLAADFRAVVFFTGDFPAGDFVAADFPVADFFVADLVADFLAAIRILSTRLG
jgi:hypothetical protein